MAKEDLLELQGIVVTHNRNIYVVEVEMEKKDEDGNPIKHEINCHLSGRLRQNFIKILVGDCVDIRVSPYDFTTGTIVYRHRN